MFDGGGVSVGITDVPGHEKFVHHMVAGVSGVGMCILVIAADDGIMPQTVEHFQIMELLGVERGVVALTKMDLVDAATLEQRIGEIRAWLAGGFLKDAPICPVSSSSGEGILDFHQCFSEAVQAAVRSEQLGIFRMPVERVFAMEGYGRVLSGVPVAGRIAEGDWVELVPGGAKGRVRGMQCFGRLAEQGHSGLCVALNIPDFARANPRRGQVLCLPGRLRAATVFHSRIRMLDRTGLGVKSGERVMLHTGTAEVQARVYGLESQGLVAGRFGVGGAGGGRAGGGGAVRPLHSPQAEPGPHAGRWTVRRRFGGRPPAAQGGGAGADGALGGALCRGRVSATARRRRCWSNSAWT